jgi:hypothetical protein
LKVFPLRYENEPCAGCGAALQPAQEDIVVCPDCGAPMHRACWQAAHQCPLQKQHDPGFRWQPTIAPALAVEAEAAAGQPQVSSARICPNCGEECASDAARCDNCGADLEGFVHDLRERLAQEQQTRERYFNENFPKYNVNGREVTVGDNVAGHPVEEIALQLRGPQRSVQRYLAQFERAKPLGWNWAAFLLGLFGPYWFFSRKLYKPGLLFAGIWLAVSLVFMPAETRFYDRFKESVAPYATQMEEATQAKDEAAATQAMEKTIVSMRQLGREFRWLLVGKAAQVIVLAVGAALCADGLLRRRILENIRRVREDVAGDEPEQRFGRHQMLLRLGGFSFFAPVLYFWANLYLPGLLAQVLSWVTG